MLPLSNDLRRRRPGQHRESEYIKGHKALVIGTGAIGREIAGCSKRSECRCAAPDGLLVQQTRTSATCWPARTSPDMSAGPTTWCW